MLISSRIPSKKSLTPRALPTVNGVVVKIEGIPEAPPNYGKLCAKGNAGLMNLYNAHRITSPLLHTKPEKGIGIDPEWKQISWDEAMDLTAQQLVRLRDAKGPESLAVFQSAKCSNEENYLLQKLTRAALGTNNIDHCARL